MTTATAKTRCCICTKETSTFRCDGCLRNFCRDDLTKHLQTLSKQLDEIENDHDELRQTIIEQKEDSKKHPLIQQVDHWEEDSINKIKQTADECRQTLIKYTNKYIIEIENKLNNLAKQLKQTRQENQFNEIDLNQLKEELTKLDEELKKPPNVSVEQENTSFINKISIILSFKKGKNDIFILMKGLIYCELIERRYIL